jgi:lipoic acid synthetase
VSATLRVRWLGSVPYRDAHALQHGLFAEGDDDWLLLLEHPHVYTLGASADPAHVLVPPASVGADLIRTDRGGDVTYHGPGQLVGYPVLTVPGKRGGGMADTVAYVRAVEQVLIDALADLGLPGAGRLREHPGVWIDPTGANPRKIAAIGVRLSRGRSMHGFALNVHPDLGYFGHIVPCGIADKGVTSLRAEGIEVGMRQVVDAVPRTSRHSRAARARASPPAARRRSSGPARRRRRGPSRARPCACADGWPRRASRRAWPSASESPSGCGPRCASTPTTPACGAPCATSTWSRCAKKRAARTSTSAGATAPPRS